MGNQGMGCLRHPGNTLSTLHALDESAMNFVYSKLIFQVRFGKMLLL